MHNDICSFGLGWKVCNVLSFISGMFSLTEITNADLDNIQNDSDQEIIGDQNEHSNEGDLLKGIDFGCGYNYRVKELEDFWTETFT